MCGASIAGFCEGPRGQGRPFLSQIETGARDDSFETIEKIAAALGISDQLGRSSELRREALNDFRGFRCPTCQRAGKVFQCSSWTASQGRCCPGKHKQGCHGKIVTCRCALELDYAVGFELMPQGLIPAESVLSARLKSLLDNLPRAQRVTLKNERPKRMTIPMKRYLVIFELNGRVVAREAVTAPREIEARIEAAYRTSYSPNDDPIKVTVTLTGQRSVPN